MADTTTIETRLGRITGVVKNGIVSFRGVRFGAPPNRFRPAELAGAWTGTYDATEFGPRAPQGEPVIGTATGEISEDCLFANIYTPAADDAGRPTLVWFHGGGNTGGSANEYDGTVLAAQGDVVVVCVNYRLGFLGFGDVSILGDEYATSNTIGYQDQTLALQWVREAIADFGGDPGNVTIFGESAGGGGVLAQLTAPAADGLFHRAIGNSPGGMSAPPIDTLGLAARTMGTDRRTAAEKLVTMPWPELIEMQTASGYNLAGGFDGTYVPGLAADAIRARGTANVPILVGSNRDEGTLFNLMAPDDPDQLRRIREEIARNVTFGEPVDGYLHRLAEQYPDHGPKELNHLVWVDRYRRVSVEVAAAAADAGSGAWLYRFDYPAAMDGLGATHAVDVPFTFNSFAGSRRSQVMFSDPDDAVAADLARRWSDAVLTFARTGDPNHDGLPEWPAYDTDRRVCMRLDATCEVVDDIDHPHRMVWEP